MTANLLFAGALEQRGDMDPALARYRQLIDNDPLCVEAHRALGRLMTLVGHPSVTAVAAAVLHMLGQATAQETEVLARLESGVGPGGRLEVASIPSEPALHPVRRVLNLVLPHLGAVYPIAQGRVLRPTEPVALAASRVAIALGLSGVQVSVEGTKPAVAGTGDPTPLQVSAELARQPRGSLFRFWVGRALASSILGGALTRQLVDRELADLFEALFVARPIDAEVLALRKRIQRALPRRARKAVEQLEAPRVGADLWAAYRLFARRKAEWVGLLTCGNPHVALEALTGGDASRLELPEMGELIRFATSDEYGNYHRSLWTAASITS